jgi:type IV pilus modification protein PilV
MQRSLQGFTLIEAMVTVLVLSIGLIGVTKMQLSIALNTQLARQRSEAVLIAQSKIEGFRSTGTCVAATDPAVTAVQGSVSYTLTTACTPQVTVTVTWADSRGASNNVVFSTML